MELELQQGVGGGVGGETAVTHSYGGVYACMVLPSLVLGTVGGGTSLATQKECLSMMGCYGKVIYYTSCLWHCIAKNEL